ncbi:MAG TPA: hypothetical protein VJ550_03000, partial [Geomonas sp.]|nr:hypothetical protein [Geomonas sp.]
GVTRKGLSGKHETVHNTPKTVKKVTAKNLKALARRTQGPRKKGHRGKRHYCLKAGSLMPRLEAKA